MVEIHKNVDDAQKQKNAQADFEKNKEKIRRIERQRRGGQNQHLC